MKKLNLTLLMVVGVFAWAFAQKPAVVINDDPGWHKVGQITASFDLETESIVVLGSDEFRSIKLKATDAPLNIERVQVHYESGEIEDIEVQNELQAGAETEELHLQYPNKEVDKVSFTYHTSPNYREEKATVELYGFMNAPEDEKGNNNDNDNRLRNEGEDLREDAERRRDEVRDDVDRRADETGRDLERTGEDTKDGIDRTVGVIGAEITDKVYEEKVGPKGEKIYIDDQSNYYYIDAEGNKVSITKAEMRNNPNKDGNDDNQN